MGINRTILMSLVLVAAQFWLKTSARDYSIPYEKDKQPAKLSLDDILLHLAQYCDKFGDSTLFFRCDEEIEETINTPANVQYPRTMPIAIRKFEYITGQNSLLPILITNFSPWRLRWL